MCRICGVPEVFEGSVPGVQDAPEEHPTSKPLPVEGKKLLSPRVDVRGTAHRVTARPILDWLLVTATIREGSETDPPIVDPPRVPRLRGILQALGRSAFERRVLLYMIVYMLLGRPQCHVSPVVKLAQKPPMCLVDGGQLDLRGDDHLSLGDHTVARDRIKSASASANGLVYPSVKQILDSTSPLDPIIRVVYSKVFKLFQKIVF